MKKPFPSWPGTHVLGRSRLDERKSGSNKAVLEGSDISISDSVIVRSREIGRGIDVPSIRKERAALVWLLGYKTGLGLYVKFV